MKIGQLIHKLNWRYTADFLRFPGEEATSVGSWTIPPISYWRRPESRRHW